MSTPTITDYITRTAITVASEDTVALTRVLMVENKIRHVPVMAGGTVVGVVSERDLLLLENSNSDADDMPVEKAMAGNPFIVQQDADLAFVAREMAARRIGSVVVCDADKVLGLFTTTDALRALADALS